MICGHSFDSRKSRAWKAWVLGLFLWLVGCGDQGMSPTEDSDSGDATVVAEVGERVITIEGVREQMRASGGALTPEDALDRLIRRTALIEAALTAGLDESEAVRSAWESALIRELRLQKLDPELAAAKPSERQLRAVYEGRLERFHRPERRRLAMITFSDDEALVSFAEAWDAAQETLPPERGFGEIALRNSQHQPSRYKGGILPWVERTDRPSGVPRKVVEEGFALKRIGAVSEPIQTKTGWTVVRLVNLEPASTLPFEEARPQLEVEARRELRRTLEEDFLRQTEDQVGVIRRNPSALESLAEAPLDPSSFPPTRLPQGM